MRGPLLLLLLALALAVPAGAGEPGALATRVEGAARGLPDAPVIDQFGRATTFRAALGEGAFVLGFTYANCVSICSTADLWISDFAARRAEAGSPARVVTLTLDPARDDPAALLERYRAFGAPEGWRLLTGAAADILPLLARLGAWDGGPLEAHELLILVGNGARGEVSPLRASPALPDEIARLAAAYAR